MRYKIVLLFVLFCNQFSFSQVMKGKVMDSLGIEIPFAHIRISNTTYGTVANADGNYQLELKKGSYLVEISAEGYKKRTDEISIEGVVTVFNPVLAIEEKMLDEVVITVVNPKDRGKEIMKQVIERRPYFKDQLAEYSCNTYCFASLEKDKLDSLLKDSVIGKEKLNLIEWNAKSYFKESARFKDEFYAYNDFTDENKAFNPGSMSVQINVDGSDQSAIAPTEKTGNPYLFVNGIKEAHFSIFDNAIDAPKLSQNPIVSPLAYNALLYYNFYFEKSFYDSLNTLIYEIKVKPKFDYEALMKGTLYVKDQTWEVVSYELGINPGVLLFFKDIRIVCDYSKIGEHLVPVRKEFVYNIKEDKTNINGLIRVSHSDYQFVVDDSKRNFWLETSVYSADAFDKDSVYWNERRPFTLKDFEKKFIEEQDSIITYHESEEFLRKNDSIRNQFRWLGLIFEGYYHVNSFKKYQFSVNGLVSQIIPFGVGGYRHRLMIGYTKEFKNGKVISVNPDIDYGFLNKDVKGSFDGSIMYNPLNFSKIGFQIGDVYDFVSTAQNITSTFAPSNRVRNQKFEVNYSRELINGLYMRGSLLYSDRKSIDDMKYPEWVNYFMQFKTPQSFERYKILLTTIDLEYHFRQKYTIRKGKKVVYGSPWPTLYLTYKKGIPDIFSTTANFDFLELKAHDEIKLNSLGNTEVKLVAGAFVHKKDLRIIEHKFFRPSDQFFFSNPVNSLQLLDTALNTSNSYLQFNFIHHFNGFFLNKIWLINRLKLEESVGGGVLFVPDAHFAQGELYAGIERKFRIRKELFKIGLYAVARTPVASESVVYFKFGFNFYNVFLDKWDY